MPTKKYLVETDKGKFMVEVDEPSTPANLNAVGGDTINGRDPNAPPGLLQGVNEKLQGLANPQSGLDLVGLAGLSSAPVAEGLASKVLAPVTESIGRGMSNVANAFKPVSKYAGVADVLYHRGGLAEGAAVAAAPHVLDAAGQGLQQVGGFLRRETPLVKLGGAAVNVERPTAAVVQAAKEAAPAAETAPKFAAAAIKARLNAAETKEYLRLLKSGKSADDALGMIQAQRDLIQRLGLPTDKAVKIEQDYIAAHGRRQQ